MRDSVVPARVRDLAPEMLEVIEHILYLEVAPDLPEWLWEEMSEVYLKAKGLDNAPKRIEMTPEMRAGVERGLKDYQEGRSIPWEEVKERLPFL